MNLKIEIQEDSENQESVIDDFEIQLREDQLLFQREGLLPG